MNTICESCGMPMTKREEFGGGIVNNTYCVHCTDEFGNLKDFEDKLKDMQRFIMLKTKADEITARAKAKEHMSKMPAWHEYF